MEHGRSAQAAWRRRAPAVAITLIAFVAASCSNETSRTATKRPGASTTTTSIVVGSRVIGGGTVVDTNEVSTFDVDGGTVKVLVPIGAVSKGTEVEVREVTGAPGDLGAIQRAGKVYDLSFKNGKLLPNKKVSLAFDTSVQAAGITAVARSGEDPAPVGGRWDDESGVWRAAENDDSSPDIVTVYAAKAGKYTWLRWSWDRAVQAGTDAIRTLVGPITPADGALRCTETDAVRSKFDLQTNVGSALAWCVGREDGTDVLRVANTGQAPLTVRYKGFGTPKAVRENLFAAKLAAALAPYWSPQDGESVRIIGPADEVVFPIASANGRGLLRAELNGFTQHYDVVSAAVAFTTGFFAGNAALAATLIDGDSEMRDALVARLAGQGCANGLGDSMTGGSYATDKLAAYAALLVHKCVDSDTAKLVMKASVRTPQGNLRSSFPAVVPSQTDLRIDPALHTAISPLVEPVGGPVAGEIIVSPRGGSSGSAAEPSFTPTGTAPAVTPTVLPATTTPAPAPTTPSTVFGTTTVGTAPPTATTTATTAAPATTTTATTVAPTTTAATTTTTTRPAVTTTTTVPSTPLMFAIVPSPCSTSGGTLTATSANFTPGAPWSATFFSPTNLNPTSGGNARADGTIEWSFPCLGKEVGTWTVEVSQPPRAPVRATFTVDAAFPQFSYDTRSAGARGDLPICSGGTVLGSPAGSISQSFVVAAPTISRVGIVNREELTGTVSIWRGGTALFSAGINTGGDIAVNVGLSGLTVGETLTLRLNSVHATAASPNHALNFFYTTGGPPSGSVSTSNSCEWSRTGSGGAGFPAVPAGADLVAYVQT